MKTRDEYVSNMKSELDRWNAQAARWEAQAASARSDLRKEYAKQLETLKARREEALYQLKLLQGASSTAWSELSRGADDARERMLKAVEAAKAHFDKAGAGK